MSKRPILQLLLVGLVLYLFSLACSLSAGGEDEETDDLRLQLTLQAMQMTQAADAQKVAQSDQAQQQP